MKWWSGKQLQDVREEFCRTYALKDYLWDKSWASLFKSVRADSMLEYQK